MMAQTFHVPNLVWTKPALKHKGIQEINNNNSNKSDNLHETYLQR
jgi:hypothetical protein